MSDRTTVEMLPHLLKKSTFKKRNYLNIQYNFKTLHLYEFQQFYFFSTLSKRKDFVGKKNDLLFCWSRGELKCCYNNIPCLEDESTLSMTLEFVEDVDEARYQADEKEEERKKKRRYKEIISINLNQHLWFQHHHNSIYWALYDWIFWPEKEKTTEK